MTKHWFFDEKPSEEKIAKTKIIDEAIAKSLRDNNSYISKLINQGGIIAPVNNKFRKGKNNEI